VEVVPANNDGSVHLGTMACSSNNPASDGNSSSEWELLVNVGPCTRIEIKHPLTLARNILQTHQCIIFVGLDSTGYHGLIVFQISKRNLELDGNRKPFKTDGHYGGCLSDNNKLFRYIIVLGTWKLDS